MGFGNLGQVRHPNHCQNPSELEQSLAATRGYPSSGGFDATAHRASTLTSQTSKHNFLAGDRSAQLAHCFCLWITASRA